MLYCRPMGAFRYPALVAHPRGTGAPVEVKFLVDTGAMFTCLPGPTLEALGLDPTWRVPVVLADGRREEWGATEVLMTLDDRTLHTTCLFGPTEALPLLGAVSLEQFALSVNPLTRTLVPAPVPMARAILDTDR